MALKTKIINATSGGTLNKDFDFSAGLTAILNAGVVTGLQVGATTITAGKGFILANRNNTTPTEQFLVNIELTETTAITPGINKKIYIEVKQNNINDNSFNVNINGTGISEIKVENAFPSSNYIPLAQTNGAGVITDLREFIEIKKTVIDRSEILASNLRGGNWKVFYTNGSGVLTELALGTAGQVLTSNGGSAIPIWTSPSIDIAGLIATTTITGTDDFLVRTSAGNRKISRDNMTANLGEATETTKGVVERATFAEVITKTDTVRYVSPAGLGDGIQDSIGGTTTILTSTSNTATTGVQTASTSGFVTINLTSSGSSARITSILTVGGSEIGRIATSDGVQIRNNSWTYPIQKGQTYNITSTDGANSTNTTIVRFTSNR